MSQAWRALRRFRTDPEGRSYHAAPATPWTPRLVRRDRSAFQEGLPFTKLSQPLSWPSTITGGPFFALIPRLCLRLCRPRARQIHRPGFFFAGCANPGQILTHAGALQFATTTLASTGTELTLNATTPMLPHRLTGFVGSINLSIRHISVHPLVRSPVLAEPFRLLGGRRGR